MKDYFNVSIDQDYFVNILKTAIKEGQEDLAVCLGSVITSDRDKEAVFKAALGIKPDLKYAIDDEVYVDLESLYLYSVDKDATADKYVDKTGYMAAKIVSIRPYHRDVYCIQIPVIETSGKEGLITTWTSEDSVRGFSTEEFPDEEFKF
jgi:hypothetical protein